MPLSDMLQFIYAHFCPSLLWCTETYKSIVQVPSDPHAQLQMAIKAVFASWYTPRAKRYVCPRHYAN